MHWAQGVAQVSDTSLRWRRGVIINRFLGLTTVRVEGTARSRAPALRRWAGGAPPPALGTPLRRGRWVSARYFMTELVTKQESRLWNKFSPRTELKSLLCSLCEFQVNYGVGKRPPPPTHSLMSSSGHVTRKQTPYRQPSWMCACIRATWNRDSTFLLAFFRSTFSWPRWVCREEEEEGMSGGGKGCVEVSMEIESLLPFLNEHFTWYLASSCKDTRLFLSLSVLLVTMLYWISRHKRSF